MPKAKDKSKEQTNQEPAQKFGAEPFEIPVLPLRNTTLFPETMVPLSAGRPASVAAVEAALAGEEKLLACISVRPEKTDDEQTKPADLFEVGTLVMIKAMERVYGCLAREVEIMRLRSKIASEAQTEMDKAQRDYVLRQQIKAINKELGEDESGEQAEATQLRERLAKADLPDDVRKEAERELGRMEKLPSIAPGYHVIRTYLAFSLELPWKKSSEDRLDLNEARKVLDEDHFGLEDVKERILEFLAVRKLRPDSKSPILCFVGAPGVGKTSLGRSISRAMNRHFERISLGGIRDEAELRGHRRTYVGAMPGRIIQSIRRAGVNNPVMMLDEIDKLGADYLVE